MASMMWILSPRERITPLVLVFLALSISLRSSDSVLGNEAISGPPGMANGSRSRRAVGGIAFAGSSFVAGGGRLSQACKSFGREAGRGGLSMNLEHKKRKSRNAPGDFFVDEGCVDCDVCCWMDPRTYRRMGLGAVVGSQPKTEEERMAAFRAMLSCPTGSIRTMRPDKKVIDALDSFPLAVDEERLPGVYQLAPTTRESMGNIAYLIVRPGKGNIMIDVPRFLRQTADKVEALGGVQYLIVTGRDKADGHERWKERFPDMVRILHRLDLGRRTRVLEERLDGNGPWHLVKHGKGSEKDGYVTGSTARFDFVTVPEDERAPKDRSVKIVGLAGQTRGTVGVIYQMRKKKGKRAETVAFSGGTVGRVSYLGKLDTFARMIDTDKETLTASVRRLAKEGLTWLLPGRGSRVSYDTPEESKKDLEEAADRLGVTPDLLSNRMVFDPRYSPK